MEHVITSRQRRLATAALWTLTVWAATDVATSTATQASVEDVLGLITGAFIYLDPMHRIWPRRRATVADLPRLGDDVPRERPNVTAEVQAEPR